MDMKKVTVNLLGCPFLTSGQGYFSLQHDMRHLFITERVTTFLLSKGFARVLGEPFGDCIFSDGIVSIALDEELGLTDIVFLEQDWNSQDASTLFLEFRETLMPSDFVA
jgi:hypothetical protein